jgi:twitching motility protein PilT
MILMDDALFKIWREEKATAEDVLSKSHNPDELARRIANAKRGVFDEEDDEKKPDGGGHGH